jgi:hypothetical protein
MKAHLLIALAILLCGTLHAAEPKLPLKRDFHLFLLAGQSNMSGRGKIDPLDNSAHPRVFVLAKDGAWKPGVDPLHYDKPAAAAGMGKPFAEILAKKNPRLAIGLIPAACGGAPISVWAPGMKHAQTQSLPYDDAIARAKRALQDGTLKAILWHQGESDCTDALAAVHEEKLRELITRLRTDLGAPRLPFIIGQLGQFGKWSPATQQVDAAQQKVAQSMPHVYFVASDKLTSADGIHFDARSLKIMAERYAEAYESMSNKK